MKDILKKIWIVSSKNRDQLTGLGLYATIGWFYNIGFLFFINGYSFYKLTANALGDFLAGSVAPVAVFWLIIGFFQQQKELHQNTEALNRQGDYLKKQIKHFKEEARPEMIFLNCLVSGIHDPASITLHFKNVGGEAIDVHFRATIPVRNITTPNPHISTGEKSSVNIELIQIDDLPIQIEFDYKDLKRNRYKHEGLVSRNDNDNKIFFDQQKDFLSLD